MNPIIAKAIEVAAKAHQNQFRKGTDIPYISHPYAVGMILLEARCKPNVVAAGILHDTLEDTDVTCEDLLQQFGKQVADIVLGCSEPDKSLSWEERKEHTIEFLKTASKEIRMVACADKLHNVRTTADAIQSEGEVVWERFKRGRNQQEWYYRQLIESLGYQSGFPLLKVLQQEVEALFGGQSERLSVDNKLIDALFYSTYHFAGEISDEAREMHLESLLQEVLTLRDRLRDADSRFGPMAEYLAQRGIEFEHSEGSELLIAFCAALKERIGLYNYEVYEHFMRNLQAGRI